MHALSSSAGSPTARGRWHLSFPLPICAVLLVEVLGALVNLVTAVPAPTHVDPSGYYGWGQAVLVDGTFDPTQRLAGWTSFPLIEINGRRVVFDYFPAGWSMVTFPFTAAGHGYCIAANRFLGGTYKLNGLDAPAVRASWIGVYFWAILGILATYQAASTFFGKRIASWTVAFFWFGTSAFAYSWKQPMMSHGPSMAILGIAIWFATRAATSSTLSWKSAIGFGVMCGLTFCIRHPDVLLLLPAVILFFSTIDETTKSTVSESVARSPLIRVAFLERLRQPGSAIKLALYSAFGALIPVGLQMCIWKATFGQWYINAYAYHPEVTFSLDIKKLLYAIFSTDQGFVFFHPISILALCGLVLAMVRCRDSWRWIAASILLSLAALTMTYGSISVPTWGWGCRWLCDTMALLVFGGALFWHWTAHRRTRFWMAATAFTAIWSVGLFFAQYLNIIPYRG